MNNSACFAILAAVLFAGTTAFAAEKEAPRTQTVRLKDGRVLEDAYILDKKPNGITLAYKEGCMFINFSDMPLEYQQKFGYDPIKSARYEKKQNEQKKALAREQAEEKEKAKKRKSAEDKRYKDIRISRQQQKISRLELELAEAQKRLDATEKTIKDDRGALGMSSVDSDQVSVESPWGYGGRIKSGEHNGAVRNKLLKEVDTLSRKRDNQAQDVMDLQLKLEAAQKTLDELLKNGK